MSSNKTRLADKDHFRVARIRLVRVLQVSKASTNSSDNSKVGNKEVSETFLRSSKRCLEVKENSEVNKFRQRGRI